MNDNTQNQSLSIIRNIAGVIVGILIGSYVNMYLISALTPLFTLPGGINPNDIESIRTNIGNASFSNFIPPFAGHAGGTLVAALLCTLLAASRKWILVLIIGVLFLMGGAYMVNLIPEAPLWFDVVDLGLAYIPMAFLGLLLGNFVLNIFSKSKTLN